MSKRHPDARLANLLGALSLGLHDAVDGTLEREGVDARTGAALVALLDFLPDGSVRRLSETIGVTHSGAVRVTDRLEACGYIQRAPADDLRAVRLRLTASGMRIARRIRAQRHAALASVLAGLTRQQRGDLATACEVMIATLTQQRLRQRQRGSSPSGGALCRMCDFAACERPQGRCPAARTASATRVPRTPSRASA